jgi:hypothetical protein
VNIDKNLVARFIQDWDMNLIIRLFELSLSEVKRIFSDKSDRFNAFNKLLCLNRVELKLRWSCDRFLGMKKFERYVLGFVLGGGGAGSEGLPVSFNDRHGVREDKAEQGGQRVKEGWESRRFCQRQD